MVRAPRHGARRGRGSSRRLRPPPTRWAVESTPPLRRRSVAMRRVPPRHVLARPEGELSYAQARSFSQSESLLAGLPAFARPMSVTRRSASHRARRARAPGSSPRQRPGVGSGSGGSTSTPNSRTVRHPTGTARLIRASAWASSPCARGPPPNSCAATPPALPHLQVRSRPPIPRRVTVPPTARPLCSPSTPTTCCRAKWQLGCGTREARSLEATRGPAARHSPPESALTRSV